MAKPRVFVSSTYYDLRIVRSDLERALRDLGFEPVMHERGHVPYSKDLTLEANCYREVAGIDILVALIGGRFGANSADGDHSISQQEIRTALKLNKQIYVFCDRNVLQEHRTYQLNKANNDIRYSSVDDVRIFTFIDEVLALRVNNSLFPFDTSFEIAAILREQLAGLFQRLLDESSARQTAALIDELSGAITSLREITSAVTKTLSQDSDIARDVVLSSHPIFARLRTLLRIKYRVFFLNIAEMAAFLKARGYIPVPQKAWDSESHMEFVEGEGDLYLRVANLLFDAESRLKPMRPDEWVDDLLELKTQVHPDDSEDEVS